MRSAASCTQNAPIRSDLAWRHATESDLERATYTIPISRWKRMIKKSGVEGYSHRALRVLRFFCALHRLGRLGYVGTRASYAAIGAAIERTTDEAASRSTVIRGVNELAAGGLIEITRGRGYRVRQIGPHEFIREPLAVLTLSEAARAIWTDPPSKAHTPPPVSKCNGYDSPNPPPPSREKGGERSEPAINAASPTVPALPIVCNAVSRTDAAEPRDRSAVAVAAPRHAARPVAPLATLADGNAAENGDQQTPRQRSRFSAGGTRPASRPLAAAALLATLERVTRREREGCALCSRAAAEIAGRSDAAPSGVEWDYWIARWPEMTTGERKRWARAEIVPLLRLRRRRSGPLSPVQLATRPAVPPASPGPPPIPPVSAPLSDPPLARATVRGPVASSFPPDLPPDESAYLRDFLDRQLARLEASAETRADKGPER